MKIFIKLCLVALLFTACDDTEAVIFDPGSGQTGLGFAESVINLSIPEGGLTTTVPVFSTTVSSQDRSFDVIVDDALTSDFLAASDYSLGTVFIPAGSHEGSFDVTINYDGLTDFVQNELVVNIDAPSDVSVFSELTFLFLREFDIELFVCSSDYQLIINFDNFGSENTWELTDTAGAVLYSGGPYDDGGTGTQLVVNNISLATGCYTFTFFDSFGDGLDDGNIEGDYSLVCAAQTVVSYASGVGNFGDFNSTDFCVN
jgi:hypothetical protein